MILSLKAGKGWYGFPSVDSERSGYNPVISARSRRRMVPLAAALAHFRARSVDRLKRSMAIPDSPHVRIAWTLFQLGEPGALREQMRLRDDPSGRTTAIYGLKTWLGDPKSLIDRLRRVDDSALRSGICIAIGLVDPEKHSPDQRSVVLEFLRELVATAADPGTHSAAAWALRAWGGELSPIAGASRPSPESHWFVNRSGLTMVRIPAGSFSMGSAIIPDGVTIHGSPEVPHQVEFRSDFWMSSTEITMGLYRRFFSDQSWPETAKPVANVYGQPAIVDERLVSPTDDHPANGISWFDALLFCNWLSDQEGRSPCYSISREGTWDCDFAVDGYRLPTEAEWEYSCKAGSNTWFDFGTNLELLRDFAVVQRLMAAPVGSTIPNAFGLFDMHGNVTEWCWDWHDTYPADTQVDQGNRTKIGCRNDVFGLPRSQRG